MAFHKLADGPLTMTVATVANVEGKFGPQFLFTSDEGTSVYVSDKATQQQMSRIGLTVETAVGRRLTFSHVQKDGKTFTNIVPAPGGHTPAAATAAPRATIKHTLDERMRFYGRCVDAALATLGVKCEEREIPFDARAIQAAAYTLYAGGIETDD